MCVWSEIRTANRWYFIGLTLIWKENELSHLLQCIHFLIFCRRQLRQLQFFSDQSRNNVAPSVCRPDDDNDVCVHYYTGAISGYFCFYNNIMMPCFNGMASCGVTTMLSKLQMLPQATDFKWVLVIRVSVPICLLLLPLRFLKWDITVDWDTHWD